MMAVKQRFCAKIGLDDDSFYSSYNSQSLTVNPRFVRVPTD
ncbi:hypothetical protein LEP1GSC067_4745 [Leptospira interrogans serovar Lora str. TE 1992]|uniref:Uncharacterized protein n=2 Tax=Leptospira interrogans TaxID=173 RepID=M6HR10_LEPIR|nr:hypothetical protein LEP1GSC007_2861 [Leptospira interrogans serovar Bulgarica str. Mallika]EJP17877.1 hypothetical protein LEP1GSC080_0140 [Leptospira interrogans str. FPW2026]EMF42233.1 hypothetical protein LEP1GSC067_4745 [Leptospira interrogans serovar Lora str. TE 1992]EMM97842.1 hypothetical protein LEP1GSC158_3533 [Leptospira interrogans serovar Zanoni str. LT2156]EMN08485.1 hypothetical protein LEP1GSC053_2431 [Leptospira interrogans serovar Muenchen str. Brem 129]